ncbi:MAG: hypothetical protein FWF26_03375 [Treponema sp.]|nr:hypothetical protein [Treponema sp.]
MVRNASQGVIRISEKNPHYFEYKGKEVLLITSAEHYGAVISKKFDYVKYLSMLAEYGLNYTRIYPGALVEPEGLWMPEDNMAPAGPDVIVPWARSQTPGYILGGNKFDLNKWDPEYFARLHDFLVEADKRNIIVEICFFNCMQGDHYWVRCPMHKNNNIQGIGTCDYITFQTLDDQPLVREQMKYIEKIITETNSFDNILYEFVDEPTTALTPSHKAYHWIERQIETAIATENRLSKKHMLAQQLEIGVDYADDDRIANVVTQYVALSWRQVGGVPALDNCYCYNKPIELNETAYVGSWIKEDKNDLCGISRLEAWEFMVGGGAGFNQLNGYFLCSNPSGENPTNRKLLAGLRNLRIFLEGFDFIKMTRDRLTVCKCSIGAKINVISEKGRQYAMYIHHSFPAFDNGSCYVPNYSNYAPVLTLKLEKGKYAVTFIKPETLEVLGETTIVSGGDETEITCPNYTLDIAIKIVAV